MQPKEKAQEILQVFKTQIPRSVYLELSDRIVDALEDAYLSGMDSQKKYQKGDHE
jgi:hypothetical protein